MVEWWQRSCAKEKWRWDARITTATTTSLTGVTRTTTPQLIKNKKTT